MEPLDRPPPQQRWILLRQARRVVVAVAGITVVLVGIALLVLPGPGVLTILVGLGMLSVEFAFARRWMMALQARAANAADRAGVPRRWRVAFPAVAILVAVLAMLTPLFVCLVHTTRGYTLVHKSALSFRYSFATEATLRDAAQHGDALAASILKRVDAGAAPPDAPPDAPPAPPPATPPATPAPAPEH